MNRIMSSIIIVCNWIISKIDYWWKYLWIFIIIIMTYYCLTFIMYYLCCGQCGAELRFRTRLTLKLHCNGIQFIVNNIQIGLNSNLTMIYFQVMQLKPRGFKFAWISTFHRYLIYVYLCIKYYHLVRKPSLCN